MTQELRLISAIICRTLYTRYMPWGLEAGREAKPLIGVYWERRWEQQIGDMRKELGIRLSDVPVTWRRGTLKERALAKEMAEKELITT